MATVPPAPPPPPAPCGNKAATPRSIPRPQHAAVPFIDLPVQETSHSSEALHVAQGPPLPSHGQEEDDEEKYHPVQETNPAPQALGAPQQDEQDTQMDHLDTEVTSPGE